MKKDKERIEKPLSYISHVQARDVSTELFFGVFISDM